MIGDYIAQGDLINRGLKSNLPFYHEPKKKDDDQSVSAMMQQLQSLNRRDSAVKTGWFDQIKSGLRAFAGGIESGVGQPFELAKYLAPKAWEDTIDEAKQFTQKYVAPNLLGAPTPILKAISPQTYNDFFASIGVGGTDEQQKSYQQNQAEHPIAGTVGTLAGSLPYFLGSASMAAKGVASAAEASPAIAKAVGSIPAALEKVPWLTKLTGTFAPEGIGAAQMGANVLGTTIGGGVAGLLGEAEAANKGEVTPAELAAHTATSAVFGGLTSGIHTRVGKVANALFDAGVNSAQTLATSGESMLLNPEKQKDKDLGQELLMNAGIGAALGLFSRRGMKIDKDISTAKATEVAAQAAAVSGAAPATVPQTAATPETAAAISAAQSSLPHLQVPEGQMRESVRNLKTAEQWAPIYEHAFGEPPREGMSVTEIAKAVGDQYRNPMAVPASIETGNDLAYDYVTYNSGDNATAKKVWQNYASKPQALNEVRSYVDITNKMLQANVAKIAEGLASGKVAPEQAIAFATDLQARAKKAGIRFTSATAANNGPIDIGNIAASIKTDVQQFINELSKLLAVPKVGRGIAAIDGELGFNIVGKGNRKPTGTEGFATRPPEAPTTAAEEGGTSPGEAAVTTAEQPSAPPSGEQSVQTEQPEQSILPPTDATQSPDETQAARTEPRQEDFIAGEPQQVPPPQGESNVQEKGRMQAQEVGPEQPSLFGEEDATKQGQVPESSDQQYQGAAQREGVQEDSQQVRQEEGGQAGNSDSFVPSQQELEAQQGSAPDAEPPVPLDEQPDVKRAAAGRLAEYISENVDSIKGSLAELAQNGGVMSKSLMQMSRKDPVIKALAYSVGLEPDLASTYENLKTIESRTYSRARKEEHLAASFKAQVEKNTQDGKAWRTAAFDVYHDPDTGKYIFKIHQDLRGYMEKDLPIGRIIEMEQSRGANPEEADALAMVGSDENGDRGGSLRGSADAMKNVERNDITAAGERKKEVSTARESANASRRKRALINQISLSIAESPRIPDKYKSPAAIGDLLDRIWDTGDVDAALQWTKIKKEVPSEMMSKLENISAQERAAIISSDEESAFYRDTDSGRSSDSPFTDEADSIEGMDGGQKARNMLGKTLKGTSLGIIIGGVTSADLKAMGLDDDDGANSPDGDPDVPWKKIIIGLVGAGLLAVWGYKRKGVIKRSLGVGKDTLPMGHPVRGAFENERVGFFKSGSPQQRMFWDAMLERQGITRDSKEYQAHIAALAKEDKQLDLHVPSAAASMQFMAKSEHPIAKGVRDRVTETELEIRRNVADIANKWTTFNKIMTPDLHVKLSEIAVKLDIDHTELIKHFTSDNGKLDVEGYKAAAAEYDNRVLHNEKTGIKGTDPALYHVWSLAEVLMNHARKLHADSMTMSSVGIWKDISGFRDQTKANIVALREANKSLLSKVVELSGDEANNEEIDRITGVINSNRTLIKVNSARYDAVMRGERMKELDGIRHYMPRWFEEQGSKAVRLKMSEDDPGWHIPYETDEQLAEILAAHPKEQYPIQRIVEYGEPEITLKGDKVDKARTEMEAITVMLDAVTNNADARGFISKDIAEDIIKKLGVEDITDPKSQSYLIARRDMQEFIRKTTQGSVTANDVRQLLSTVAVRRPPMHYLQRKNVLGFAPEKGSMDYERRMQSYYSKAFDYMMSAYEGAVSRVGIIEANNNAISYMAERGIGSGMRKTLQDINAGFSMKQASYGATLDPLMNKVNKFDSNYFRPFLLFKTIALNPGLGVKNLYNGFKTHAVEATWQAGGNPFKSAIASGRALMLSPFDCLSPYKYLETAIEGNKSLKDLHIWFMNNNVYDASYRNSITDIMPQNLKYGIGGKIQEGAYYFMKVTERFNRQMSAMTMAKLYLDAHPGDFEGAKFAGLQGSENAQGLYKVFTQTEAERWLRRQPLGNTFYTLMSSASRASELTAATMVALATKPGLRKQAAGSMIAYLGSSLVFGGLLTAALTGDVYNGFKMAMNIVSGDGDKGGALTESFDETLERKAGEMFNAATGDDPEMGRMFFRYIRAGVMTNITGKNFSNDQTITGILQPAAFSVIEDAAQFGKSISGMEDGQAFISFARLINTGMGRVAVSIDELKTGSYLDRNFNKLRDGYGPQQAASEIMFGRDWIDAQEYDKYKNKGGAILTEEDAAGFIKNLKSSGIELKNNLAATAYLSDPQRAEALRKKIIANYHSKSDQMQDAMGLVDNLNGTYKGREFLRSISTHGLEEAGSSQEQEQLQKALVNKVKNFFASEAAAEEFAKIGIAVGYAKHRGPSAIHNVAQYLVGKVKTAKKEEKQYAPMYTEVEDDQSEE